MEKIEITLRERADIINTIANRADDVDFRREAASHLDSHFDNILDIIANNGLERLDTPFWSDDVADELKRRKIIPDPEYLP